MVGSILISKYRSWCTLTCLKCVEKGKLCQNATLSDSVLRIHQRASSSCCVEERNSETNSCAACLIDQAMDPSMVKAINLPKRIPDGLSVRNRWFPIFDMRQAHNKYIAVSDKLILFDTRILSTWPWPGLGTRLG